MAKAKVDRKTLDLVFVYLGLVATVVLVAVGSLAWVASDFVKKSVTSELSAQNIYFPELGSPALASLPDADRVAMEQFAGEQLTTGEQAKVYANSFIGVHLSHIADGKTYSQVSAEAMKDPDNAALAGQKQALFQGETLRGLLLGDGYAFWTMGQIAYYAAVTAFGGALVMVLLVVLGLRHVSRAK
ncbi:hypothetical protein KC953_01810 [Candidatus Saccharibacteria bacterium]|nr:hypothetical protein [Candidatus Saccharibacteria bacterium]